jgi:hypothetical protein
MWGLLIKIGLVIFLFYCVLWPMVFGSYNHIRAYYWWMKP